MSHLKSKLATVSMVALVTRAVPLAALTAVGAVACSHNPSSHANSAPTVKPAATYSPYGPPMGEAAGYMGGPPTEASRTWVDRLALTEVEPACSEVGKGFV